MEEVKKHIPNIKILTEKDFNVTSVTKQTNTPWGFHTQEEDLQYSIIGGYHAISDKTFFNTFDFVSHDQFKSYNYYKNPDGSLPKAVIVGDSFTWMFLLPDLSESFSELAFINVTDIDNLKTIIDKIKPDIVIEAGLAGNVYGFASYKDGPPGYVDAQIISTNTPTEMIHGKTYDVNIIVKNTGAQSWSEDRELRLSIFQDGQDRYRVFLPAGIEVKPGEEYTFVFKDFQAPPAENSTYLEYQMVEEGIEYFGQKVRVDIAIK